MSICPYLINDSKTYNPLQGIKVISHVLADQGWKRVGEEPAGIKVKEDKMDEEL